MLDKKFILMAILLISLLSISAVSAADDATSDIVADSNDETVLEESVNDADLEDSQKEELGQSDEIALDNADDETIGVPAPLSFENLNEAINGNADSLITLNSTYINYNVVYEDGVTINKNCTIDGNNNTLSGYGNGRIFTIPNGIIVTLKNINFIDGNSTDTGNSGGGAICIENEGQCTAINCTFTQNTATGYGGAIYADFHGQCTAINCTFTQNTATSAGGAIYHMNGDAVALNCTFTSNTANHDGAMYGEATNCNFTQNTATKEGGALRGEATNCNFTQNSADAGGAMWGGIATNCYFTQNTARHGGAVNHVETIDCIFTNNTATIAGGAIYNGLGALNCIFTQNTATSTGGAIYKGNATNCNFTQNNADYGGAMGDGNANNCNFTNNYAKYTGGAMSYGNANNCNFTQNTADTGGAICIGEATNCNFTQNTATNGGAMDGGGMKSANAINCTFTQNNATEEGGAIANGNANNCNFTQNTAEFGGAICIGEATNCNFTQNTATKEGGAICGGAATNCNFTQNSAISGGAIAYGEAEGCTFILNTATDNTMDVDNDTQNENSICIIPVFSASNLNTKYNYGEKFNFKIATADQTFNGVKTVISIYKNGTFVKNYTALSGSGWTVSLPAGTYKAVLSIAGSNVAPVTKTIKVAKNPTKITAKAVTATYNVNKYLVIKITDGKGKAISGLKVTVTLGTAKNYKTDKNGQIKINVAKKVPKTYTVKIKYAGNANYIASSKSVKVTVKKATPKMTAKAKSFRVGKSIKKYTITLKNNKGKVMKKVKVTLTINKKTYTLKTNKYGKATFKITNLKKRGKYTAVIKYAGSKYYKKLTKKARITVTK